MGPSTRSNDCPSRRSAERSHFLRLGGTKTCPIVHVVEIQDADGLREVDSRQFPNPNGTVANEDNFLSAGQPATKGFLSVLPRASARPKPRPENVDHFKGPANGTRVQTWRRQQPFQIEAEEIELEIGKVS